MKAEGLEEFVVEVGKKTTKRTGNKATYNKDKLVQAINAIIEKLQESGEDATIKVDGRKLLKAIGYKGKDDVDTLSVETIDSILRRLLKESGYNDRLGMSAQKQDGKKTGVFEFWLK